MYTIKGYIRQSDMSSEMEAFASVEQPGSFRLLRRRIRYVCLNGRCDEELYAYPPYNELSQISRKSLLPCWTFRELQVEARQPMDELNHLELIDIAVRSKGSIDRINNSITEARARYNGPAIAETIEELEETYNEIAQLEDGERRAERERNLARTRERFGLERLWQNQPLSRDGFVSLGRVIYHGDRASEAFDRWVRNLREGHDFAADARTAIAETAEALHWAYLVSRPPDAED